MNWKKIGTELLSLAGLISVVAGVALFSMRVAVIVAGLIMTYLGIGKRLNDNG